jgi:hypothetical protein
MNASLETDCATSFGERCLTYPLIFDDHRKNEEFRANQTSTSTIPQLGPLLERSSWEGTARESQSLVRSKKHYELLLVLKSAVLAVVEKGAVPTRRPFCSKSQ